MNKRINVVVGIIYNSADCILIAKRREEQHLSGLWEFPGGKVYEGEDIDSALKRELNEELGITAIKTEPVISLKHDYPGKKICLIVRRIREWHGKAEGKEGQQIEWVSLNKLQYYSFPTVNKSIIKSLYLPSIYLISQPDYTNISVLTDILRRCYKSGLKIFQLRLASRKVDKLAKWTKDIKVLSEEYNARFILNGQPEDIDLYQIDGIHLKADQISRYKTRPIDNQFLLGASCHSKQEIEQAALIDVDYIFLSPLKKTASHPGQFYLGWDRFSQLVNQTNLPVYALGGMQPSDLYQAQKIGAQGIAMLSAVWNAKYPERTIKMCPTSYLRKHVIF